MTLMVAASLRSIEVVINLMNSSVNLIILAIIASEKRKRVRVVPCWEDYSFLRKRWLVSSVISSEKYLEQ